MMVAAPSRASDCDRACAEKLSIEEREIGHYRDLHAADKKLIDNLTAQRDDAFKKAEDKSPAWFSSEAIFLFGVLAGAGVAVGAWRLLR